MRGSEPERLITRLRRAEQSRKSTSMRQVRGALGDALAASAEVERGLDALRAQGYRENADGSWTSPDGRVIRL